MKYMKGIWGVLYLMALVLSVAGCAKAATGTTGEPEETGFKETAEDREEETAAPVVSAGNKGNKSLVVYFSCTGTTGKVAEYAAAALGADLYKITPEEPYTSADLNYGDAASRATAEQKDEAARPGIVGDVEDMDQYEVVLVGYPIWWGQAPRIISTFLERYDFSGKMIIPFCTSGSSGIGSSAANLHSLCADTVTWMEGTRFGGDVSRTDVEEWVNELEKTISGKEVKSGMGAAPAQTAAAVPLTAVQEHTLFLN